MGIEALLIAAVVASVGTAVATSVSSSRQAKKAAAEQRGISERRQTEITKQQEADTKAAEAAETIASQRPSASRRLALISTSPTGTSGRADVGRSKLFGN